LWLGEYLKEHIVRPEEDLDPLLNTVLVFSRARTSALQNLSSWNQVSKLAKRLNAAADAIGHPHHRLELVRRGPKTYFITCTNSPRFNWNVFLSHRDVGLNLDYFAPGHMAGTTTSKKSSVHLAEKGSFEGLTGEWVFLEYLNDESTREWKIFNETREKLCNAALQKFGLEYRIKSLLVEPGMVASVRHTMAQSSPPSLQWWEDYCFFVNGFLFPEIPQHAKFAFCGFDTKYDRYWALLRSTFVFTMKYCTNDMNIGTQAPRSVRNSGTRWNNYSRAL